jgi:hypothetical protein
VILEAEVLFIQSSEEDRSNVHGPESGIDCYKTNGTLGKDVADIDPVLVPSNPAVMADESDLDVGRILEKGQRLDPQLARDSAFGPTGHGRVPELADGLPSGG